MKQDYVSKKILNRLPRYLNYLKSLPEFTENISATTIAKALELGEVQVRKDLAKISDTGRRRTGRKRVQLIQEIETYLNYNAVNGTIVVGAGKLMEALLDYDGFTQAGLNVMAGFDSCPAGNSSEGGKPIYHLNQLEAFCRCYEVNIGAIAVADENIQMICDRLIACGVNKIWNFTHSQLQVPDHVIVQNKRTTGALTGLGLHH